jgi:hypothetical protein
MPGSPVIDKGQGFGLSSDQLGQSRPWDDGAVANAAGGDGSDIGALEKHPPFVPAPGTGLVIISFEIPGPMFMQMKVQGEPNVSYQLQMNEFLATPFVDAGPPVISDGLGLADFTNTSPQPERRFYKVVRAP